jgi:hypothetical protein
MSIEDELRTIKYEPILDIQLGAKLESEHGLPMGSRENLEQVIANIELRIKDSLDALDILDDKKHFFSKDTIRFVLENCFEPCLKSAQEKLEQIKWE